MFSSPKESYVKTLRFVTIKPKDQIFAGQWIQLKSTVVEVWNKCMQVRLEKGKNKPRRTLFFM